MVPGECLGHECPRYRNRSRTPKIDASPGPAGFRWFVERGGAITTARHVFSTKSTRFDRPGQLPEGFENIGTKEPRHPTSWPPSLCTQGEKKIRARPEQRCQKSFTALQPLQKFFDGPTGLFDDGPQCSWFKISGMKGNRHKTRRQRVICVSAMLRGSQKSKAASFQYPNNLRRSQCRQPAAHAPTSIVSQPASSGMGRFNSRRQARTFSIASRAISFASASVSPSVVTSSAGMWA